MSTGAEEKNEVHIPIPTPTIQERVKMKSKSVEDDFSKLETKIHRFPPGLRLGAVENRYIVPSFVALGPYHHGTPHLQHVEDVKHAAAHYFCQQSGHSIEEVYGKIFDIADEARSCYADEAVAHLGKADLAEMFFLDGCFLLMYMAGETSDLLQNRMTLSTGPCMLRDIFLLENQLPWLILEALMTLGPFCCPYSFVFGMAKSFVTPDSQGWDSVESVPVHRPPHLLGLLRYYQCGGPGGTMHGDPDSFELQFFSLSSSAIELAEIGVELTASANDKDKTWFADMSVVVQRGLSFPLAKLSLTPLFLNDFTACWLVNMAAYEACISTRWPSDDFLVSSYISLLAMLIDKEEDVHVMRAKHIIQGFFSNHEVLVFFKGLSRHLRLGSRYFVITEKIEQFKRRRPVRIGLHMFIYNNIRTIVALLSIASVLVGIFRTLMSLKQHQQ